MTVPDWKGEGYRLPTEAEWEYACRGGNAGRYGFGDDASLLGEYAWFDGNSGNKTHEVRQKRANGFGLFDMHGNVWEWCWDGYADKLPRGVDPRGPEGITDRVVRGGGWGSNLRGAAVWRTASGSVRNGSETRVFAWPEVRLVSRSVRGREAGPGVEASGANGVGAEHPPQVPERAAQCISGPQKDGGEQVYAS